MDLLILVKSLGRKMQEKFLDNKPDVAAHGCNELSHLNVFRVVCFTGHSCWGEEYLASHLNAAGVVGVQHRQKLIHFNSNLGPFCLFGAEQ